MVPTRSAPGFGRPGQAFWLLWRIADRAKLEFCGPHAPEEITLRPADVRDLLRVAWSGTDTAPDVDSIPDEALAITLTRKDFEQLVTRDIDEIMDLAYELARERLSGTAGRGEPVDRIILTGQVSRAPLVPEASCRVLRRAEGGVCGGTRARWRRRGLLQARHLDRRVLGQEQAGLRARTRGRPISG